MSQVVLVPYRQDNYGFLIVGHDGAAIAIDAGDDAAYLQAIKAHDVQLQHILITHHHADHTSHLSTLRAQTGATVWGPKGIPNLDHEIAEGGDQTLAGLNIQIIATPGYTLDMLNFYIPDLQAVFTGDTLFTLGCGRLFEGTPELMLNSMQKLKTLPDKTWIYGAHEYTLANLDFALNTHPENESLKNRAEVIRTLRDQGKPTVPSTIGAEKATNPFLIAQNVQEFTQLRAAKDAF